MSHQTDRGVSYRSQSVAVSDTRLQGRLKRTCRSLRATEPARGRLVGGHGTPGLRGPPASDAAAMGDTGATGNPCRRQVRMTNVTKVNSEPPTDPVTSQQPSVGKDTPLAWKPVDP